MPGTSPSSPYLAYAAARGDGRDAWDVVVIDVRSGEEVTRVPVTGAFTWGGWDAPPVSVDRGTVYVGLDDRTVAVDVATGSVTESAVLDGAAVPVVGGGHAVTSTDVVSDDGTLDRTYTASDVATGEVLVRVSGEYVTAGLSPDGRYLKVAYAYRSFDEAGNDLDPREDYEVYDLEAGTRTTFTTGAPWDFGWTPDGHRLRVTSDGVAVCEPTADRCEPTGATPGSGSVRIGGVS